MDQLLAVQRAQGRSGSPEAADGSSTMGTAGLAGVAARRFVPLVAKERRLQPPAPETVLSTRFYTDWYGYRSGIPPVNAYL
jgi:hypothetical protein